MKETFLIFSVGCSIVLCNSVQVQQRLYHNEFPLSDVTLLEGPFKLARDLNIHTLLEYKVGRFSFEIYHVTFNN